MQIFGILGFLVHLFIKFKSSVSSGLSKNFIDYLRKNLERLLVSLGTLLAVILYYLFKPSFLPSEISLFFDSLKLDSNPYLWFMVGYTIDSLVRNLTNLLKSRIN